jgi:predicted transcriptional regulator
MMFYISILMLTSAQLRAARALVGVDQRTLAELAGVSLPTIQRMEAAGGGHVRGMVESLTKVVEALERAGVELIKDNEVSSVGGRGVRLREAANTHPHEPSRQPKTSET